MPQGFFFPKEYYHVTHPDNILSIKDEGLKANEDGEIYLFSAFEIMDNWGNKIYLSDHIAINQVFIEEMVTLCISADGINGELVNDNVAEFTAQFQWILKQEKISPEYVRAIPKKRKPDIQALNKFGKPPGFTMPKSDND